MTNWNYSFGGRVKPKGKKYKSLGEGHTCEISNCGKQAYAICEGKATRLGILCCGCEPAWEGCGSKLCGSHIEQHYSKEGIVIFTHCRFIEGDKTEDGKDVTQEHRDTECGKSGKASFRKQWCHLFFLLLIILISFVLLVALAKSK